jgi:hypothetical protein
LLLFKSLALNQRNRRRLGFFKAMRNLVVRTEGKVTVFSPFANGLAITKQA